MTEENVEVKVEETKEAPKKRRRSPQSKESESLKELMAVVKDLKGQLDAMKGQLAVETGKVDVLQHTGKRPPYKAPTDHEMIRVRFQRFDQPRNVFKARLKNREIDWEGQLIPGKIYDLPEPVVKFLRELATPIFEDGVKEDGKPEPKIIGWDSRCSLTPVGDEGVKRHVA